MKITKFENTEKNYSDNTQKIRLDTQKTDMQSLRISF